MARFSSNVTRRNLLRLGAGGVLGWSLPQMLALQATADSNRRSGKAKNVLVILEQGGMSHIDTWDPKPDVVLDHRSPYKPVATRVPGMQFTELLTKTACIADKLTVVRSMHHRNGRVASGHPDGTQYALSGSHPGSAIEMPDIGSMVAHVLGTEYRDLPPYILVPTKAAITTWAPIPSRSLAPACRAARSSVAPTATGAMLPISPSLQKITRSVSTRNSASTAVYPSTPPATAHCS